MVDNVIFASSFLSSHRIQLHLLLYTDPGAGALLWQLLLASLIGGAFYARLAVRQVKTRIAGLTKTGSARQTPSSDRHSSQAAE